MAQKSDIIIMFFFVSQVRVSACSVNPLDVAMSEGYGFALLNAVRGAKRAAGLAQERADGEFPLTLGRDFSGEVVSCGSCAARRFRPGQKVFGAVLPSTEAGAHSSYVVASQNMVQARKLYMANLKF